MTLNQLLKEVYALGFDEADELNENFIFAVNRALKMIYTELIASERLKISVSPDDSKDIDLLKLKDGILFITSAPLDSNGFIIKGARVDGYTLSLPSSFSGDAFVYYKPAPQAVTVDHGEYNLNVPEYAAHLLSLLVAFFVLLDDDGEKADYYMSLYRNEAMKITRSYAFMQNNTYTDVTGWA